MASVSHEVFIGEIEKTPINPVQEMKQDLKPGKTCKGRHQLDATIGINLRCRKIRP